MVDDPLGFLAVGVLADLRKHCALQDLCHIGIPLQLVAFFLPRSQVTAHEAEVGLMQRHTH